MRKTVQYHNSGRQGLTLSDKEGFTLVELLVVIAIIIILALTAFVVINPLELQKQGRDGVRVSDLAAINQAIQTAVSEASGSASYPLCAGVAGSCSGASTDANARLNTGAGWVKVNVSATSLKMPSLPLDPSNTGNLKYEYSSNGTDWELDAVLESQKYQSKMDEGGSNPNKYEVGTDLSLIP